MHEVSFESTETMTQEEFARFAAERERLGDCYRCELLNGRVVMTPPAGDPHGRTENRIQRLVGNYVAERRLGEVFGSSAGFELPSGDTVEPDCAYVSREKWRARPVAKSGFVSAVPDLVVEILSRKTRSRDVGEKKAIYERNGVHEYWVVDPRARTLTIFLLTDGGFDGGTQHGEGDRARSTVLAGLEFAVADLFPGD